MKFMDKEWKLHGSVWLPRQPFLTRLRRWLLRVWKPTQDRDFSAADRGWRMSYRTVVLNDCWMRKVEWVDEKTEDGGHAVEQGRHRRRNPADLERCKPIMAGVV